MKTESTGQNGTEAFVFDKLPFDYYLGDNEVLLLRWLGNNNLSMPGHFFPLALWGESGTGKSVLAETIASRLARQRRTPANRVLMLSAAEFRRRFVRSVNLQSLDEFRCEIGQLEILVIDDIDGLKSSQKTQQELIRLADVFQRANKCLLVSSREPFDSIDVFLPRLSSRLAGGLSINLKLPGQEIKEYLIRSLSDSLGIQICNESVTQFAQSIHGSCPLVYQQLLKLESFATNQNISPLTVEQFIASKQQPQKTTTTSIAKLVARKYEIKLQDLRGKTRRQMVVDTRAIAMYLCRKELNLSYQKIGDYFGKRDHSTARHSIQLVQKKMAEDLNFADEIASLTRLLRDLD